MFWDTPIDVYCGASAVEHPPTQPAGGLRTMREWCLLFDAEVIDPDGWRGKGKSVDDLIDKYEFANRWAGSSCRQPPSRWLLSIIKDIDRA
jgi:hypothetical protein